MTKGILVGCDQRQEWLLKWWWHHYSKHNDFPVTFCDFGMSTSAKNWCAKRGQVIALLENDLPIATNRESAKEATWAAKIYNDHWNKRHVWFAKAFILPQTPYQNTLWLDVDCEVKQNLEILFTQSDVKDGFAISISPKEHIIEAHLLKILSSEVTRVQTGVFVFKKDSPIIQHWVKHCLENYDSEHAEESALSNLLHRNSFEINFFSPHFNWCYPQVDNPHAVIIHHTSVANKTNLLASYSF